MECYGKHEVGKVPCFRALPYNCGRKCGNDLECSHHKCELECHDTKIKECLQCERPCQQPRHQDCNHECAKMICHPGECGACKQMYKNKCHCGRNYVYIECNKWIRGSTIERDELSSCKVPCSEIISCGHECNKLCHKGDCSKKEDCVEKVILKCKCKTLRKSLLCNQIKNESSDTIELKVDSSKKIKTTILKCNERCAQKRNKSQDNLKNNENDHKHTNQNNINFNKIILISILVLITSFFIFYLYYKI
jgi:hypothetical protein